MGLWNCFLHPTYLPKPSSILSTPSSVLFTFEIGSGLIPASCFSLQTAETTAVYTNSQLAALLFIYF